MIPFWLKLLRTNNRNRGFGLTLPFLIGATRIPAGLIVDDRNKNIDDIRDLLLSMRNETPDNSYVSITVCDRLNQPVFAEASSYFKPSDSFARIPSLDEKKCSLYVVKSILPHDKQNAEGLLEAMWIRNSPAITQGLFSYSKGSFRKFSDHDLTSISYARNQFNDENDL